MPRKAPCERDSSTVQEHVLLSERCKERPARPERPQRATVRVRPIRTPSYVTPTVPLDLQTLHSLFDATAPTDEYAALARPIVLVSSPEPSPPAPVEPPPPEEAPVRPPVETCGVEIDLSALADTPPEPAAPRPSRAPLLLASFAVALSSASFVLALGGWRDRPPAPAVQVTPAIPACIASVPDAPQPADVISAPPTSFVDGQDTPATTPVAASENDGATAPSPRAHRRHRRWRRPRNAPEPAVTPSDPAPASGTAGDV